MPIKPKPDTKPSKQSAETMSAEQVRNFFGEEVLAEVFTSETAEAPREQKYNARDFKGALLTDERVVIYMTAELCKGTKTDYYKFHNPMGQRVLVFPADAVLETNIEGLVDQKTLDAAVRG